MIYDAYEKFYIEYTPQFPDDNNALMGVQGF